MIAAFLITLRETIEASLIVALVLGVLSQYRQQKAIKRVWAAVMCAFFVSIALLLVGSSTGRAIQTVYTGHIEAAAEGSLLILSAIFITWTVFFLHAHFSESRHGLAAKIRKTVEAEEETGIFWLTFVSVLREGVEIVIFLSTIFLSSTPEQVLIGSFGGLVGGVAVAGMLFVVTAKEPVSMVFRTANTLLILFAVGMISRGIHELIEIRIIPKMADIPISFLPPSTSISGTLIRAVFGLSQTMEAVALAGYLIYILGMGWWMVARTAKKRPVVAEEAKN